MRTVSAVVRVCEPGHTNFGHYVAPPDAVSGRIPPLQALKQREWPAIAIICISPYAVPY
jgi:hypothetical protein